jgi:hypothetical protein
MPPDLFGFIKYSPLTSQCFQASAYFSGSALNIWVIVPKPMNSCYKRKSHPTGVTKENSQIKNHAPLQILQS